MNYNLNRNSISAVIIIFTAFLIMCSDVNIRETLVDANKVSRGRNLESAFETDVNYFFIKRMTNRPRKAAVGSYQILFKNAEWVYWGYPVFYWNLFSSRRVLKEYYKTGRPELDKKFPEYNKYQGYDLRLKIHTEVTAYKKRKNESYRSIHTGYNFSAGLAADKIYVNAPVSVNPGENAPPSYEKYEMIFSRKDLTQISIKRNHP